MKIGKIAGADIELNLFLILIGIFYAYLGLLREVIIIFSAVFLHELAHTLTGWALKIKIEKIQLFPFGGQAQIADLSALEPAREIYLAIAGPAFSLFIAGFFYFWPMEANQYLTLFIMINFCLGIFNLLPALPLDGGRILRAILSRWLGYRKATQRAALLGKIIAIFLGFAGLYFILLGIYQGANLICLGIFLFWAAHREAKHLAYVFIQFLMVKKQELARKGFLISRQIVGFPRSLVKDILNSIGPDYYTLVIVVNDSHQVVNILSEAALIDCLMEKGPQATLDDCI